MESHKSHVPNHQPYIYIYRVHYNTIVFIGHLSSAHLHHLTSLPQLVFRTMESVSQSFRCTVEFISLNANCILNPEATHQKAMENGPFIDGLPYLPRKNDDFPWLC